MRKFTKLYIEYNKQGEQRHVVSLCPAFMNIQGTSFPHGIFMGNVDFDTETQAQEFANKIEGFLSMMALALLIQQDRASSF